MNKLYENQTYTNPVNPKNESARIPATTRAIGTPFISFGTSIRSKCSRIPANSTIARVNPTALAIANTTPSIRLNSFWIVNMATPKTAQFVVMSGKNTPNAEYNDGLTFFRIISTICTKDAITNINTIVCIKPNP